MLNVCVPVSIPTEMYSIQEEGKAPLSRTYSHASRQDPFGKGWNCITSESSQEFALQPPVRLRSILLPHYLPVFRNSCLPPAVNYATVVFTMKAHCL